MTLSPTKTIAVLLLVLALSTIVLAAIAVNALGWLVVGICVIGVSIVALLRASAKPISIIADAALKNRQERNRHMEEIIKHGFSPLDYSPVQQLAAPEYDIPISTSGETATTITAHRQEALEVLALTKQWHSDNPNTDSTQIIPQRFAKKMHPYFTGDDGFQHWHNGMKYLIVSMLAQERKAGNRSLGTYAIGGRTAAQLYEQLRAG